MELLIYIHCWAPSVGGVETVNMVLARGLAEWKASHRAEKINVTVVTQTPAHGFDDSVLPFRVDRRPGLRQLIRLIRGSDLVHMAGPSLLPIAIALMMGKPVVIEHHGFQAVCPNGQLLYDPTETPCPGYFMAAAYKECFRCNSKFGKLPSLKMLLLTFPRRWLSQSVSANIMPTSWLGSLLRLNRMKTIVHGMAPLVSISESSVKSTIPVFAFIGRLVSTKGVRILIEAASFLKAKNYKFQVRIIGDGPHRQKLEKLARDLDVQSHLQFLGYVSNEKCDETLENITAVVMPSLGGEVFGLVAAENMQRGRLVIASNLGALSEVLGDSGMTFATGDPVDLAHCMEEVIANPRLADEIRVRAPHRIAALFSREQMIAAHVQVYRETCGR
jgi:glycogen(starch) synthase